MVFKPFTHLARQSFAKTFTHGYAQSVVAATQSSYASSTTPFSSFGNHNSHRYGKNGTPQLHSVFQNAATSSGIANKATSNAQSIDNGDSGLAAYYDAWQKQQQHGEEREWKQFQFAKRIGWEGPSVVEGKGKGKATGKDKEETRLHLGLSDRGGLDRSYSTSAVDDIKKAEDKVAEDVATAAINKAIADEIDSIQLSSSSRSEDHVSGNQDYQTQISKQPLIDLSDSKSPSAVSTDETAIASDVSSVPSDFTVLASERDAESHTLSEHISMLSDSGRYAEIPPMFESMLVQGLRPSVKAYNGLLAAAVNLPKDKHQIVPKALNVYSDMLRRKLLPDTNFFSTLIQILSCRAIDVFRMKAGLEKKRLRFGGLNESGRFLLRSNEAEYDILADDDAVSNAIKLYDSSMALLPFRIYSAETYRLLITACAMHNRVDDMIRTYSHMESLKIIPTAKMFPPMIEAFAASGDLSSVVECYNEYKSLAIADDSGRVAIIDRKDEEVYAAVVKAYASNGNRDGGDRFFTKIVDSFASAGVHRKKFLQNIQDRVILDALVQERLDADQFSEALEMTKERHLSPPVHSIAMARICAAAADFDKVDLATKAYQYSTSEATEISTAALSMLALHVRRGDVDQAREYWTTLVAAPTLEATFLEPTTMYAIALIGSGHVDEGLVQARQAFTRIRTSATGTHLGITDEIDECIEVIGAFLADRGITPSPQASMSFLWAMVENGGLVSPVAEQMLEGLNPDNIGGLSWQDLTLALQIQAEILSNGKVSRNFNYSNKFACLIESVINGGLPLEKHTMDIVGKALQSLSTQRPDLVLKWQNYLHPPAQKNFNPTSYIPKPSPSASTLADSFDPYAMSTDHRGSTIIADGLDNQKVKASLSLNDALIRFRNIRRAGRHPRYVIYAKLISSAAKEGRINLIHDILGMARQDLPFQPQYAVVRHGWSAILDAAVGACLTVGNRTLAAQFHQELLDIGARPTANTFGLYITTLKESTKTFDEATEAVKIFHRAKSEGVEPSSFLYNALIGKLGKARRIDDCLFYFAEMRALGIRPTSVTYGTIVNALCRVSDERFAEELFDEMESMPNYKPKPAPYNSLMQFFLITKRDSNRVLAYYERMQKNGIQPTMHTYKLLIDTYATLDPINLEAAEGILDTIRASGQRPDAVHYASLIHAKGCVLHDMDGARRIFDEVLSNGEVRPQACLYQALFESMVANHCVKDTEAILDDMSAKRVEMTPYIANTLIHGWAMEKNIAKSKAVFDSVGVERREPSTYEAMTRAFLTAEDRESAMGSVNEMLSRGYPSAVSGKILELLGHGS